MIVDSNSHTFSLPRSRVERLTAQVAELRQLTSRSRLVPARLVAQLVGLLWAAAPCCPRAVAVMARGMVAILSRAMRRSVWDPSHPTTFVRRSDVFRSFSLKHVLRAFWDGDVPWDQDADRDLRFWSSIDFTRLRAPISADTLEVLVDGSFVDASVVATRNVGFLASDASETACGGGLVHHSAGGFSFVPGAEFFSPLTPKWLRTASAIREALAILWMLRSLAHRLPDKVIVFCDSQSACEAIKRGSRSPELQSVIRDIFMWALCARKVVFPCWVLRSSNLIEEADRRSRWSDTYGQQTPPAVFWTANELALQLWGSPISFDRQASHTNVMPPGPRTKLPFNARWHQPGCAGVDMFLQPRSSWTRHVNFVHPAAPTAGRVFAFLPFTRARTIVVVPTPSTVGCWWSAWARRGGPGVVAWLTTQGFTVVAVDHSARSNRSALV